MLTLFFQLHFVVLHFGSHVLQVWERASHPELDYPNKEACPGLDRVLTKTYHQFGSYLMPNKKKGLIAPRVVLCLSS